MTFGERVRQLREAKGLSLRKLSPKVGVGFSYLCRVETGTMTYGDYPSDALIHRLADVLEGDEEELLLLAERIPKPIQKRVFQRPDAFLAFASCDDKTLDKLMSQIGRLPVPRKPTKKK